MADETDGTCDTVALSIFDSILLWYINGKNVYNLKSTQIMLMMQLDFHAVTTAHHLNTIPQTFVTLATEFHGYC